MKVRELLETKGKEVFSMDAGSSVEDAIHFMHGKKISAIMVTDQGKTAGIFTERDVVRSYIAKSGRKFREIPVGEAMTKNLLVAELDEDINNVMSVMVEKNIRHLPVVDKGQVIGMLSIRDVINAHVGKITAEMHYLKDYIAGF
jgi:CBS domain-containing protein